MQDQIGNYSVVNERAGNDSADAGIPVFIETVPDIPKNFSPNLYSKGFSKESIPDWYFIVIILAVSGIAWARIVYGKFLNALWVSSYSYQAATKVYKEQSIVQKRFSLGLDFLYLINATLFLFVLNRYFGSGFFKTSDLLFVFQGFLVLSFLVFIRVFVMRLIAFIFNKSDLILGFLYHFFIFNKVLGLVLIPFLITIPYTKGLTQEIIVYTGISIVILVYLFRLIRAGIYVLKNVILLFYLILYLCILEILPVLVVYKLLLSLAQV